MQPRGDKLMPKKNITVDQRQAVAYMTANNNSVTSIRRTTGLHDGTIKKLLAEPATMELVEQASKLLSEKMLARADEIIDAITDGDIEKAGLRDKTVAAGILMEKGRLSYGFDKPPAQVAIQINNGLEVIDLSRWRNT
jgi:hypothetical protein